MTYDFDLFVIGGGSGGVRAARIAASYGAKTGLAEEYRMGGTCVIRGCVPKKLMVQASDYVRQLRGAQGFGHTLTKGKFDFAGFMEKLHIEVSRLSELYMKGQESAGVDVFNSRAVLTGQHEVKLEETGKTLTAHKILIATGGQPWMPDKPGTELAVNSNDIFQLKKLPEKMVIIGSGYIALEFAHIFAALGTDVSVICRGPRILRGFDEDVSAVALKNVRQSGIQIYLNTEYVSISEAASNQKTVILTNGETLNVDTVLMATGRRPYTQGLGLENIGVETANNGAIIVDDFSRTNAPNIWAVGDVTDRINLTPVAIREGHAFADTEFGGNPRAFNHKDVASAVFVQPEIGTVGITEAEAISDYGANNVQIYQANFKPLKNAISGDWARYYMKLVCTGPEETVRGVHIVGDGAAEMIQMVAIAVKMGATKAQFDATCAVHPTAAEELVTLK